MVLLCRGTIGALGQRCSCAMEGRARGRDSSGIWGGGVNILLDLDIKARSGIHHSTLMCSRELSLDLLPSPLRRLDCSSRELSVVSGFFDELRNPLSTVIL